MRAASSAEKDVARSDHGDAHALGDLIYGGPVGLPGVQLARRSPVHGDRGSAGLLHAGGEIGRRVLPCREPTPDLHGDGNARLTH